MTFVSFLKLHLIDFIKDFLILYLKAVFIGLFLTQIVLLTCYYSGYFKDITWIILDLDFVLKVAKMASVAMVITIYDLVLLWKKHGSPRRVD